MQNTIFSLINNMHTHNNIQNLILYLPYKNTQMKKKTIISISIILIILILDQILKIWIKTNMSLGESFILINNFATIHFTENPGMAFGMQLGGTWGKLALSIFRIIAITGLVYYLITIIKNNEDIIYIICISLVIAGATGNLIDSAFYGLVFNHSEGQVAQFLPDSGGYAPFLHGKVVDMFRFVARWPSWVPSLGGKFIFPPIFNIADSAITISVFIMIISYKRIFAIQSTEKNDVKET